MTSALDFRDSLIAYLLRQKDLEQEDIEKNKQLTEEEKVQSGLLIKGAVVVSVVGYTYELQADEDNTKLKVGDVVVIRRSPEAVYARVIEVSLTSLFIETEKPLHLHEMVDVEITESIFLDPLISILQEMHEGMPGFSLLKQLSGTETPRPTGLGRLDKNTIYNLPDFLNERQLEVIHDVFLRPSLYCIQGPPGTGKTAVLASIAKAFSSQGKEVLIIANTHQAVNNALNKVVELDTFAAPVKIGEAIKSEGLHRNIMLTESYNGYLKERKKRKGKSVEGDIVGMTLHSAAINLGLRNTGHQPQIILIDEAGQMPMPYASIIGAFGAGCIVFIGDDNQMPPIFHKELSAHPFAKSIFEYLCALYPQLRKTLNVTYRMNEEITAYIDSHYYGGKDPSQKLIASEYSRNRKFPIHVQTDVEPQVREALSPSASIYWCNIQTSVPCTEANPYEADMAYKLAKAAIENGLSPKDIAIITPFRKQVKTIRAVFHDAGWGKKETPLVNTVECLQGQDVECIIISFAVSDETYFKQHYGFIMDKHRLNVMISRAKTKVIGLWSINHDNQI